MYEDIFKKYDAKWAGQKLQSKQAVEIGLDAPVLQQSGKYSVVSATVGVNIIVTLTGRYLTFTDGSLGMQIMYNGQYGYIFSDTLDQWAKIADNSYVSKTQSIVSEMIDNHKIILENNLLCARALEVMAEKGTALPISFRQRLYALQTRLMDRNVKMKQSGYITDIEEGTSPNFSVYNQSIVNFMNNPGIGFAISTTAAIIITCIIVAATAAAAWAIFKTMHAESKVDFKYSNDLTADLIKYLPAQVYEQLMRENAANAAKANAAIKAASGKQLINTIKYAALGFGLIWGWEKLQNLQNNGNTKLS